MARTDIVLTVRYMTAHAAGGSGGIGRFIRYVQYRDAHPDSEEVHDLDGLIRYVHHRDRTSPRGQLFDAAGPAGDEQRRDFVHYVARSTEELHRAAGPRSTTSERAVYRFILSPRDARGLDLKRLTRTAMSRLAADIGRGDFPPWIAGEHRNTAHAHVHVILAARQEQTSAAFRSLVITKPRLARMKQALHLEMTRQRDHHLASACPRVAQGDPNSPSVRRSPGLLWRTSGSETRSAMTPLPGLRASQQAPHDVTGTKPNAWHGCDAISGTPTRTVLVFGDCADAAPMVWMLCREELGWWRPPTAGFAPWASVGRRVLQQPSRKAGTGQAGLAADGFSPRGMLIGSYSPGSHTWPASIGRHSPEGGASAREESAKRAPRHTAELGLERPNAAARSRKVRFA